MTRFTSPILCPRTLGTTQGIIIITKTTCTSNVAGVCRYWNRLEMYCRDLSNRFEQVHVITGPLFSPELDQESGKTYVKYEVSCTE